MEGLEKEIACFWLESEPGNVDAKPVTKKAFQTKKPMLPRNAPRIIVQVVRNLTRRPERSPEPMSLGSPSPLAESREPVCPELGCSLVGTITAASISGVCDEDLGFQGSSPNACTVVGFFLVDGSVAAAGKTSGRSLYPSLYSAPFHVWPVS